MASYSVHYKASVSCGVRVKTLVDSMPVSAGGNDVQLRC